MDGLKEIAVSGVRKRGDTTPVTKDDLWHLGSDTKAMTATLAGVFVAEKRLAWDDRVLSYFLDLTDQVPSANRRVTIAQLLRHEAGLAVGLPWTSPPAESIKDQRQRLARLALAKPSWPPGKFHYSSFDYVVVGAILEKVSGQSWEELMRERLFKPLGMHSAGFGGVGTPGRIDQPWPHAADGTPEPINGYAVDLPQVLGSAGNVHCTMADWSKFLVDQLRGAAGINALLPPSIYERMQSPAPPSNVGFGWGIMAQPWWPGKVLTHAGSNGMNYCICLLSPSQGFGVLVCTNQGGDSAEKACNEAISTLVRRHFGAPL